MFHSWRPVSSWRSIAIFSALFSTACVYAYMLFVTVPEVQSYAGGRKILDLMPFGYDFSYVSLLFQDLGGAGRNVYLYTQIPVDMIYPGLFATSFGALLFLLLRQWGIQGRFLLVLSLLPVIGGILDYAENIQIAALLRSFPELSVRAVSVASMTTVGKSIFSGVSLALVGILALLFIFQKGRNFLCSLRGTL